MTCDTSNAGDAEWRRLFEAAERRSDERVAFHHVHAQHGKIWIRERAVARFTGEFFSGRNGPIYTMLKPSHWPPTLDVDADLYRGLDERLVAYGAEVMLVHHADVKKMCRKCTEWHRGQQRFETSGEDICEVMRAINAANTFETNAQNQGLEALRDKSLHGGHAFDTFEDAVTVVRSFAIRLGRPHLYGQVPASNRAKEQFDSMASAVYSDVFVEPALIEMFRVINDHDYNVRLLGALRRRPTFCAAINAALDLGVAAMPDFVNNVLRHQLP